MFQILNHKTYSDRPYNEDTYGYDKNFLFVIDGATGLKDNDVMGYGDDAAWFVNEVRRYLLTNLTEEKEVSTVLKEITTSLLKEYKQKTNILDIVSMPSSCIALFREKEDILEFYGLGDCVGIIEFKDGSLDFTIDLNLETLDDIAIDEMVKISKEKNISPIEARPYIQDILSKHRALRNKENGYYSLDLSGEGVNHAITKQWKIQDVNRIACVSDGLYEVVLFDLYTNFKSLLDAMETDIEDVFKTLYNAQEEDAQGYKVPRFKKRDDTTGIIAKIV